MSKPSADRSQQRPDDHNVQRLLDELERTRLLSAERDKEIECVRHLVAHDLRAPLRAIDAFSRILLEESADGLGKEAREQLGRVHRAIRTMESLLNDALTFLRPVEVTPTSARVDLSAQVKQILDTYHRQYPERRVETIVAENVSGISDERLCYALLEYLLDNAWKFTSQKPQARIEFGSLTNNGKIAYYVKDNGAGFDTKYKHKLFLPFQRLHSTSQFPGSGIGLAMAQRIMFHLRGQIWAEAEIGQGATFYFTLGSTS